MIIDDEIVALLVSSPQVPGGVELLYRDDCTPIVQHWSRLWEAAQADPPIRPLYEDLLASSVSEVAQGLIVFSDAAWSQLIRQLSRDPSLLHSLSPRRFEEVVASLLQRQGLDVILTPQAGDRGRDILAFCETVAGRHLYLVECKRYAPDRPVGVQLVRALYGVVAREKATAGVLVTTSRFTSGAKSFEADVRYRLALREYDDIVSWLQKLGD